MNTDSWAQAVDEQEAAADSVNITQQGLIQRYQHEGMICVFTLLM